MPDKKGIVPNSFQTPNAHVDHAMQFLSGDEYKVLNFAVRHILGWHDRVTDRKGRISLTTFCDGFTTKTGEHYGGTGLSRQGIVDIVERLDKWGLLIKDGEPTAAGQEYTIGIDPDWELIISDHAESTKGNKARGEKLRAAKAEKAARQGGDQSMPQTSGLSDRPVVYETDHDQSIGQTDDQSMPQTHTNTSSNTSTNPQKIEDNTFPSGNERALSDGDGTPENVGVEESTEDTTHVEETTPENGERSEPLTPSSGVPLSPYREIFGAVEEVWKHNGARAGNIAAIIGGISQVKGWKQYNFVPAGNAIGVRVFGAWYKLRCSGLNLPEEPEAIQAWYYKMRVDYEANPYQPVFDAFRPASHTPTTHAPDDTPQETIDERRAQQWQIIYEALELQIDKANFDMWLRDVRLLDFNEETQAFVIGVRSESAQQFLSYRLNREISSVLRDVASGLVDIRWTAA